MEIAVHPAGAIRGTLVVPGDKAIAHRALILAALASGTSRIDGISSGLDTHSTIECLTALATTIVRHESQVRVEVHGNGWTSLPDKAQLDAGNSATTMRLAMGALAGADGSFTLLGDESLSRRPMDRVARPLQQMGARISLTADLFAPVAIRGGPLIGIEYQSPVASAQVKSAILLAGLQADGATEITEPAPTRDHTERLLLWLGAPIEANPPRVRLAHRSLPLQPFALAIPGDFSSAAYAITAAVLCPSSELNVSGVGLNPTRTGLLEILSSMGASFVIEETTTAPEPMGSIRIGYSKLQAANVGGDMIPRAIDELPLVALAATQAVGKTVVQGARELRVKETDRIRAITDGLRTLGAAIEETSDGFEVEGPTQLRGGRVDSLGDHRIALTFAVAGMISEQPVWISGWEAALVSYPTFLQDMRQVAS